MPRPCCKKAVACIKEYAVFKPKGIPLHALEEVLLTLDEIEALRLADLQGLYQEAAARSMQISRQTFGRIIASAHKKISDALLNGKALRIAGGNIHLKNEQEEKMKIAIPTIGDQIDSHFGHCEKYSIYTVEGTSITAEETLAAAAGCGCKSNIASTLAQNGVTVLIAGGIGAGAINVLASNGIQTIRGADGQAKNAVERYLRGELADQGDICHAHDSDHACSGH
jgi:predicted DNA-binding protein (UPF0251 family)/predicted Fe-Mo cluster-binding NifX family protein